MKKVLLLIILLGVLGVHSVNAQIAWGARLGLCYSTASGEGGSIDGKPSIELGPTAYYSVSEKFYLNSGLMFSIKNFDADGENLKGYYLDIPIYAGYAFSSGKTTFYAQAGPFVGFKLGESWELQEDEMDGDILNTLNAGLGIAAGVNIKKFKIELGYQHGLVNVANYGDAHIGSIFAGVSYVF